MPDDGDDADVPSTKTSGPRGRKQAKSTRRDSRARVEALKRQQRRAERRRTLLFVGGFSLVGLVILGLAIVPPALKSINSPTHKSLASFGVPVAGAGCAPAESPEAGPAAQHVGPGTDKPAVTKVDYNSVPPVGGEHYAQPLPRTQHFYARGDAAAKVEQLVHNEEHGYTVLWYDKGASRTDITALKDIATKQDKLKFIVAPWDEAHGAFPDGKHVAVTTWGHKQVCASASGALVADFMKAFPGSKAPEPNGI
ncbi:MAG: DUF3105 domain-containing protein [Actinomycetota bacterium]|nr:DUF3105 domain-containing protein [Actinomycetota bacterium]